ncbi:MAG TPA: peptide deformylase [Nitrolancea sp.]|nr:peptide deformylase [Nitrolancea sp.]
MTSRQILSIDHPLLRKQATPVTRFGPALRRLADDMFETLQAAAGRGLAAPQVGRGIRLFVAEDENEQIALCNPMITLTEGETFGTEGCLSFPGFVGLHIRRAARIEIQAQDLHGAPFQLVAEGYLARVVQHEIDHLDGILFLDHLADLSNLRKLRSMPPDDIDAKPETGVTADEALP